MLMSLKQKKVKLKPRIKLNQHSNIETTANWFFKSPLRLKGTWYIQFTIHFSNSEQQFYQTINITLHCLKIHEKTKSDGRIILIGSQMKSQSHLSLMISHTYRPVYAMSFLRNSLKKLIL